MGRIRVLISDDLEGEFRSAVADSMGFKKWGQLRTAVEEALRLWINSNKGR